MLSRVQSFLLRGIDASPCEVEVDHDAGATIQDDRAKIAIVGLPDVAVRESIERVRTAMRSSGYEVPLGRVLINLAPADVKKEGPLYDLPIAVGLLMAIGVLGGRGGPGKTGAKSGGDTPPREFEPLDPRQFIFAGELALDGRLRPVRGVIALASMARAAGARGVIVPRDNAPEAAVVADLEVIGVSTLSEAVAVLSGEIEPPTVAPVDVAGALAQAAAPIDFADVRGQEGVKRAMTIAAAGHHNLLMLGPAGTGKTMMARALPGILPPLSVEEALEITRIYSAAGQLPAGAPVVTARPVRTPHHTASAPAIVGGGAVPRPGEISLAHRGVLFLDELPEFDRDVLETLRQPLEDHCVTIARSHSAVRFPASVMLVAAMNPTPKGDMPQGEIGKRAMDRYLSRLSGPLIDRIDIHVEAPAVPWKELSRGAEASAQKGPENRGTGSAAMRRAVLAARDKQSRRQGPLTPNSRLSGRQLDTLAPLSPDAKDLVGQAMSELGLSARAYDKIRRVARTIADLDDPEGTPSTAADVSVPITAAHVAEAIGYRLLDRRV